eukprot:11657430-Ditylum_brightwellii.AAC.1
MFGKVLGKGVTMSAIVGGILRTINIRFVANFTFSFIYDARVPTFPFICALTINTTRLVTVTWTVHEIQ